MLKLRWAVGRLVWESRGQKMETVSEALKAKFPGQEGFSVPTIQRLTTKTSEEVPEEVAQLILALPIQKGFEETAEVVSAGLAALEGTRVDAAALAVELAPKLPTVDPEVIARAIVAQFQADPNLMAIALLARFPTDELALKLAEALATQAGFSSGTGSLFDVFARAIADRLPRMPKLRTAKLARHLTRQLDRLSARRLALSGAAGGAVACVVGLLFVMVSDRLLLAHAPASVPQEVKVILTNLGPGSAPLAFDMKTFLGAVAGQMGGKVVDQYIPDKPLPNQKLPPCLGEAGESEMNGGCWANQGDVKPPCGRYLFRGGDKCYRPIAADPSKRVGE